jgi:hypothetical protein
MSADFPVRMCWIYACVAVGIQTQGEVLLQLSYQIVFHHSELLENKICILGVLIGENCYSNTAPLPGSFCL